MKDQQTHKEALLEWLKNVGAGYAEEVTEGKASVILHNEMPMVEGYSGFYVEYSFNPEGDLLGIGIFE